MLDFVIQELGEGVEWRVLLEAYRIQDAQRRSADPQSDGWVPRLARIDSIESAQLSGLHGKLIALGLLRFEISGKAGMQYQLSPLGRQTLNRGENAMVEVCESAETDGDA